MRFLSLCSGIEAASVAWAPLGWEAAAFAEIEPFPSAILAHHYPEVPNLGDMTKFQEWPDLGPIDLVCGGTPCQSFSNAGLRKGLDDPRGNLMLTFGAIVAKHRPKWLVFENVPGLLSSGEGRDFASLLGLLSGQSIKPPKDGWQNSGIVAGYPNAYGLAWRVLDAQYTRVDGYARAVPQRRNRVFVVGCLGDWRSAAAVLSERESLQGNPAPRRKSGSGFAVAPTLRAGGNRTGGDRPPGTDVDTMETLQVAYGQQVSPALKARDCKGPSSDGDGDGAPLIAQPLPFDTTQITSASNYSNPKAGDPCRPLASAAHAPAVAFGWQNAAAQGMAVDTISPTLDKSKHPATATATAVRRLMPVECERLMGFPDGYTAIPLRNSNGKPNGKMAKDGPRYKALGNSWAVNCARWIGRRIDMVEGIQKGAAA